MTTKHLSHLAKERKRAQSLVRDSSLLSASTSCSVEITDGNSNSSSVSIVKITPLKQIWPLNHWTTSIGMKHSVRVEGDSLFRQSGIGGRGKMGGGGDAKDRISERKKPQPPVSSSNKYGLRVGSVTDEEVIEYAIRVVVLRLGDSDQVFTALKTELGLPQAYTDYLEHKKRHERDVEAAAEWKALSAAVKDVACPFKSELDELMENMRSLVLKSRRQHPQAVVRSSLLSSWKLNKHRAGRPTALRPSSNFEELSEHFTDSFCRMCFTYDCQDHGTQHPLPLRRIDPMYPAVSLPLALHNPGKLSASIVGEKWQAVADSAEVGEDASDAEDREQEAMSDPSDYIDVSHVKLVVSRLQMLVGEDSMCGSSCWKLPNSTSGSTSSTVHRVFELEPSSVAVITKLRSIVGDSACILSTLMGSVSCNAVHKYLESDGDRESAPTIGGRGRDRRSRTWHRGRGSTVSAGHQDLLQRTRDQRLRDRGCANHEYKPCSHEGSCNSMACGCMSRDHMCEKACSCPRDCPNRYVVLLCCCCL